MTDPIGLVPPECATLEERAALTSGSSTWTTAGIPGVLPQLLLSDGPHGLRVPGAGSIAGRSAPATCFPTAAALGSSWNPDLAAGVGAAIGREARAAAVNVVLGPGLNIKRSPLCGRNFEYLSEDPHLTGQMGAAVVRGIQSQGVGATIKHFAVNNQETDRMRVSAQVDERALHEIYLAAFEQLEPALAETAVELARRSDVVLLFLGLPDTAESEGADRASLALPQVQLSLLEQLADCAARIVVILSNGGVVEVASWDGPAAAVLEAWLPGQAGGAALADVLSGHVSPGGRLTETIPLRLADTPCYLHFPGANGISLYGESSYVGCRYYDTLGMPVAYPFGFGLTYSSFEYSNLAVTLAGRNAWTVEFTVANTGARDAADVPQVNVGVDEPHPTRPVHELRSFRKLHLAAGGSCRVSLILSERDFALWNVADHRWSVPAGEYRIEVVASSRDIRLHAVVSSPGDGHRRELTEVSTVAEWLADPDGRAHLEPVLARIPAELLEQAPEVRHIVWQLPAVKLCGFGLGLDAGQLRRMVAAVRSACAGTDDRAAPEGAASA